MPRAGTRWRSFGKLSGLESLHIECNIDKLDIRFEAAGGEACGEPGAGHLRLPVPVAHHRGADGAVPRRLCAALPIPLQRDNFSNNCFVLGCDPHFNLEKSPDEELTVYMESQSAHDCDESIVGMSDSVPPRDDRARQAAVVILYVHHLQRRTRC